MADPWGAIGSEVWRAKRFRPLNDMARMAYFYVHTSPQRNAIGLFRLSIPVMADDMKRSVEECRDAITTLVDVKLIDYDEDEVLVRVRDWEKRNAPDGPQEAIGRMIAGYDKAPDNLLTETAFLCFAYHILHKAAGTAKGGDGWKVSEIRLKMEEMIFHRLKSSFKRDPNTLWSAFTASSVDPSDNLFDTLWASLNYTGPIPYGAPPRYKDTDIDPDIDPDHDKDSDPDPDPDQTLKSGNSDIQADIAALKAKADSQ